MEGRSDGKQQKVSHQAEHRLCEDESFLKSAAQIKQKHKTQSWATKHTGSAQPPEQRQGSCCLPEGLSAPPPAPRQGRRVLRTVHPREAWPGLPCAGACEQGNCRPPLGPAHGGELGTRREHKHTPRLRPQTLSPLILIPFLISQSPGFKYNLCIDSSHIYTCNLVPDFPLQIPSCTGHPSNRHRPDTTTTEPPSLFLDLFLPHSPQRSKWHLLPSTCSGQTLGAMLNCSLALIQHNQSLRIFSTLSSQ